MISEVSQNAVFAAPTATSASPTDTANKPSIQSADQLPGLATQDVRQEQPRVDKQAKKTVDTSDFGEKAEELADNLNEFMQHIQRKLSFSVDDSSGGTIIQVIDMETKETVRQIPPDEILTLRQNLSDVQEKLYQGELPGLLFKTQA